MLPLTKVETGPSFTSTCVLCFPCKSNLVCCLQKKKVLIFNLWMLIKFNKPMLFCTERSNSFSTKVSLQNVDWSFEEQFTGLIFASYWWSIKFTEFRVVIGAQNIRSVIYLDFISANKFEQKVYLYVTTMWIAKHWWRVKEHHIAV